MQMLFQAEMGKQTPDQVRATFWKSVDTVEPEVRGFAEDLFRSAIANQEQIDELIVANSRHWRLERMPAVDRNVLRLGVWELLWTDDVPDAVAISEAMALVTDLSTDESPQFVNGVLGAVERNKSTLA